LATNRTGYQNLIKLSSIGFLEGFYRRPRIDREVLERHREGLACLAACLSGEIALYLRQGNYEAAAASARWFATTFPGAFWLEVQDHGIPEEQVVRDGMYRLAGPGTPGGGEERRALDDAGGRRGRRPAAGAWER